MVAELTRPDEVGYGEEHAKKNAQSCNYDVRDAEEGVLAAYYGARANDDGLCPTVVSYVKVYIMLAGARFYMRKMELTMINIKGVSSSLHRRGIVSLYQFTKGWQACQSHPDLERLIVEQVRVVIITIIFWVFQGPVGGHGNLGPFVG